jgi:hypothetical protein
LSFENLDLENLEVMLKSSKNYLKFSIKNHLKFSSDCADHCVMFALSKEKLCEHEHERKCQDCNMIDFSIDSLKKHIQSLVKNEIQKSEIYKRRGRHICHLYRTLFFPLSSSINKRIK